MVKLSDVARWAVLEVGNDGKMVDHPLPPPYRQRTGESPVFEKLCKAIEIFDKHQERSLEKERSLERGTSIQNNARMEGFNGILKAARGRARGYRTRGLL